MNRRKVDWDGGGGVKFWLQIYDNDIISEQGL